VNSMRRQCLDAITVMRRATPKRQSGEFHQGAKRIARQGAQKYIFSFLNTNQLSAEIVALNPDYIYLPLDEIIKNLDFICKLMEVGQKFAAVLDKIVFDSKWQSLLDSLSVVKNVGITNIVCGNISQIAPVKDMGFTVRGDSGLNIMNSQAMREIKDMGAASATLSFEMNTAQIRDLSFFLPCEMLAYGRLPLMITENCIIKNRTGRCSCDSETPVMLSDKTGRSFPVIPLNGCRSALYNAEPLWLADKLNDLNKLGVSHLRLCFTTENANECTRIANAYANGGGDAPQPMTRGLYFRGVE
ncbi:MAG: U32 family peptidase, partial [Oscillospiraceae bacterium]